MSGMFLMLLGWLWSHAGQTRGSGLVVKDREALLSSLRGGTVGVGNFLVKFSPVSWSQKAASKDWSFFYLCWPYFISSFRLFNVFLVFCLVSLMHNLYRGKEKKKGKGISENRFAVVAFWEWQVSEASIHWAVGAPYQRKHTSHLQSKSRSHFIQKKLEATWMQIYGIDFNQT